MFLRSKSRGRGGGKGCVKGERESYSYAGTEGRERRRGEARVGAGEVWPGKLYVWNFGVNEVVTYRFWIGCLAFGERASGGKGVLGRFYNIFTFFFKKYILFYSLFSSPFPFPLTPITPSSTPRLSTNLAHPHHPSESTQLSPSPHHNSVPPHDQTPLCSCPRTTS